MKKKHTIGIGLVTLLLSGCVTADQAMQNQVSAIPEEKRAYIVGTYRVECVVRGAKCHPAFNSISAFYRNKENKDIFGKLSVSEGGFGGNTVFDFVNIDKKEKGIFFCQSVPAGDYSLYSYSYWNYDGGGNGYNLREENFFNIPFRATAGEIVYVGDIRLTYSTGKSMLGLKTIGPGVVELSSGNSSDAQTAVAKCAESVRQLPLKVDALRAPAGGHELVVIKPAN